MLSLSLLGWSSAAWSADYYLEGPSVEDRSEAVKLSRAASQEGHKARVERHAVQSGWVFTVRIDGFSDREAAAEVASALGGQLDISLSVRQAGEAESADTVVSAPRVVAAQPDAATLVQRSVRAHQETSASVGEASTVVFEFQRRLPDGEVIDHRWVRRGEDRFVQLDVISGEATSSRTRVIGDQAWLKVGEASEKSSSRLHALEAIAAFEPTEIIPFVLAFPAIAAERREIQLLQFDGKSELEGSETLMLRYDGDRATGPIAIELDPTSYRVRRVIFEGGKLVHQFDDYGPGTKDLVLPGRVRTWRDGRLADDVEIRTLDLDPALEDSWFGPPESR